MRGKLMFLGGLAAGFVLGSRAGRPAYERIRENARKVADQPTVREAAGVIQSQATRLYEQGRDKATEKLGNTRFGERMMNGDRPVSPGRDPSLPLTDPADMPTGSF